MSRTEPAPDGDPIGALAPWFHNLHLPDGRQTAPQHPLGDFPSDKWRQIARHLPEDLRGWRALDVGCNAGFYSLELAKRGAHVTGIDMDEHFLRQAAWAAGQFGLSERIQFRQMQVYDLARDTERFDLVLFCGVFYHLRYPLLGLDLVAARARRLLVFQSLTIPGDETVQAPPDQPFYERDALRDPGWPKMAFIEHALAGDPTNWWVPNHAGVEAMLRSTGMRVMARPGHEIYLCEPSGEPRGWSMQELTAATGVEQRLD